MVAICRLCASLKNSETLTFIRDQNHELSEKLLKCCQLNINLNNILPRGVCPECIRNLNASFEFYSRVQESQRALEKLWNVRKNRTNEGIGSSQKENVLEEQKACDLITATNVSKEEQTTISTEIQIAYPEGEAQADDEADVEAEAEADVEAEAQVDEEADVEAEAEADVEAEADGMALSEWSNDIDDISVVDEDSKAPMEIPSQKGNCSKNEEVLGVKIQTFKSKTFEVVISGKRLQDPKDVKPKFRTDSDLQTATAFDEQETDNEFDERQYEIIDVVEENQFKSEQFSERDDKLHYFESEDVSFPKEQNSNSSNFLENNSTWFDYSWKCVHCSQIFSSARELAKHYQHDEQKETVWVCADCLKVFPRYYSLINHVRQRHRQHLSLLCDICNENCKSFTDLDSHRQSIHDDLILKMIMCSKCGKGFNSTNSLQIHSKCHLPDDMRSQFNCNLCSKNFRSSSSLKFHQKMHAGLKEFVCDQCGKKFIQRANLEEHLITHIDYTPYECDLCNKFFKTSERLSKHKTRHTDEKPYKCNWNDCVKTFRTKDAMNSHIRIHTGEMPFRCDYCQKPFRFRSTLLTHHNVHTGIRPYSCDDCNHQFTNWPNYNKHMKRRHGIDVSSKNPRGKKPSEPKTNINKKVKDHAKKITTNGDKLSTEQEALNDYSVEEEHVEDEELGIMELEELNPEFEPEREY